MSRDHYIPQVLLKRFAEAGAGKTRFIVQYGKDHCIRTSTRNVGFEKYFHGKDGELEHQFSQLEGEWAHLLRKIDSHPTSDICELSTQINDLLWTLIIRTRYFRNSTESAFLSATKAVAKTFSERNSRKALRQRAETMLLDKAKLLAEKDPFVTQQNIRKIRSSIRKRCRTGELDDYLSDTLHLAFGQPLATDSFSEISRNSHIKMLEETIIHRSAPPDFLRCLTWRKLTHPSAPFILGDSIAFCINENGNISPLIGTGKDFAHCFLPISSMSILIGSQSDIPYDFEPDELQKAAAVTSANYFYSHIKTENLKCIADELIGKNSDLISDDQVSELKSTFWQDFDRKTSTIKKA